MEENETTNRSPLGIDLNEIPSSSSSPPFLPRPDQDAFDLVRSYHDHPDPSPGMAAAIPDDDKPCAACGGPRYARMVVCDGCERGLHVECAGNEAVRLVEDWLCEECVRGGARSKRWPLGVKSKRIFDINASPPSDGGGEVAEELMDLRRHIPGHNSVYTNEFSVLGNGFRYKRGSECLMDAPGDDVLHKIVARDAGDVDLGSPLGRLQGRLPYRNSNEILLQGLKEFVSERHGVLEEGWSVELKHSTSGYDLYAVYCSPDGKTFGSVSEVAYHLGLTHKSNSMNKDGGSDGALPQEKLHLPRKRKSKKYPYSNGLSENKNSLVNGLRNNSHGTEASDARFNKVMDAEMGEDCVSVSQSSNEGLPVQFEDFFILSLGKIDVRPSYHDVSLIWPVGYRSCWHDKVTGSIFMCEVLDGGDSGPLFRINRFSCSTFPIPDGSTVLCRENPGHINVQSNLETGKTISSMDYEDDGCIEMILADPSPPMDFDILACLRNSSNENCSSRTSDSLQTVFPCNRSEDLPSSCLEMGHAIGEITVEERSSQLAWRIISKKFIDAYFDMYKREGRLKFSCRHVDGGFRSLIWDAKDKEGKETCSLLAKFCGSPDSAGILDAYNAEHHALAVALSNWLDQDRFGLDSEFVQEMIEKLPGVEGCSRYEVLRNRVYYSKSVTIGNGLLVTKRKNEEDSTDCFQSFKRPRFAESTDDLDPPPGKLLCSRLPPMLVGDVYQVWELLWRFHEILGLKEPLSLEQLEEELVNQWSDHFGKPANKIDESHVQDLHRLDCINGQMSSLQNFPSVACSEGDLYAFKEMETGAEKDGGQTGFSSVIHRQCSIMALMKVHILLLGVLITELLSKVAAFVDPNFDSGEFKSKRGRRKDADNAIPSRRSKLNTLPVNELTWPELARRYILGVLAMDGNLDSAEITARESAKVFRCLQGDGGILCGSLTGIAGMEADALLLAGAVKQIFGSLGREKDFLTLEEEATDASDVNEKNDVIDDIPEWAKLLEPVRKLPTNVGTRIRKCVNDALEKCPPEWAKQRLEHSISKAVYKGNASGPTKKAVISVLEDVRSERVRQNSEKRNKRKITIPLSDILMKKCRSVLRRAAAGDNEKVFCTLLGRNLINSCDNDDEGLLGSPAIVSRPMDFRTIDLRLAVGAYGVSYESFLEDVREVWNNIRTVFADQPDYVKLAGTLSENFESLYEKEVIPLVQKFEGYAKLDHMNAETKKELDDILASINEIPKAPWDEGICKVCGVDKDDDSVLLCDSCDAEYHTYCLNPPLTRIPEGNWYCPSCVVGEHVIQERSTVTRVTGRRHCNKRQGAVTRGYLEAIMHLAAAMEERDYWDFSLDERIFMLKFLCDELLNSSLVHQHLEHCVETAAELQQKLRSFSAELKNLKSKEEFLVSRAAKKDNSATREEGAKDVLASAILDQAKHVECPPNFNDRPYHNVTCSDNFPAKEGGQEEVSFKHSENHHSVASSKQKQNCASQNEDPMDSEDQVQDLNAAALDDSKIPSREIEESFQQKPNQTASSHSPEPVDGMDKTQLRGNLQDVEGDSPRLDDEGFCRASEMNGHFTQQAHLGAMDESQAYDVELNTIKSDIHHVQKSINSIESQLLNPSLRIEFLGSDSRGYLYWASNMPGRCPQIIVDRSLTLHEKDKIGHKIFLDEQTGICDSHSSTRTCLNLEGSKACFPFMYNSSGISASSPWVCYETDAEIEKLLGWLKEIDPKERELKDSILQCLKGRLLVTQQTESLVQKENQADLSVTNCNKAVISTKAALSLEKKYGACPDLNTNEIPKKLGKKMRATGEERMYRCNCLEPIWPSRLHCASCHRTFFHSIEFDTHNDGRCHLVSSTHEKNGDISDSVKAKRNVNSEASKKECIGKMDVVETSESGLSGTSLGLIKFQNKDSAFPFDFKEITSKFLTEDSNHKLVQEIGLIGSNGIPSFVTSISPYLSDSTLLLISSPKYSGVTGDWFKVDQRRVFPLGNRREEVPDNLPKNETSDALSTKKPPLGCLERRERKSPLNKHLHDMGSSLCCEVPQSSLKPLTGKVSHILRRLKCNLLDMEAALSVEALRPSRAKLDQRATWRAYVKSAKSIYEMVQATIVLEEMIKTEFLRSDWWYWSSLSAAAKTSTVASLALRIYSLDAAIIYEKAMSDSDPTCSLNTSSTQEEKLLPFLDDMDKCKVNRKSNRKRKEVDR